MKKFVLMVLFLLIAVSAYSLEIVRQKNAATYITFPIVDVNGDVVSSAAGLDSEMDAWGDGSAPDGFADLTNEATEISTTGIYYLSLTASEMNNDYVYITVKSTTTDSKDQHILIRTITGDPLLVATTSSGLTIDVEAGGTVGVDLSNVNGTLDASEIGTDAIGSDELASTALAEINAEVDTALSDIGLDHLVSASVTGTDVTDNSIIAKLVGDDATADWDTFDNTTDSLEALRNRGDAAWLTATGFSTHTAANVRTEIDANSTQLAAILADTASLDGTKIPDTISLANINSQVDTALSDIDLDHLTNSALPTGLSTDVALGSVIGQMLDDGTAWSYDRTTDALEAISGLAGGTDWSSNEKAEIKAVLGVTNTGTPDNTPTAGALYEIQGATFATGTDSLEALRNRGDAAWITATGFSTHSAADVWTSGTRTLTANTNLNDPSAASIADAIWDEATAGHTTAGTYGKLVTDNIDAAVSSRSSHAAADVWSVGTRTITGLTAAALADMFDTDSGTTYGAAVSGSVVKEIADNAGGSGLTTAAIADAVWDEALSGHATAGTAGKKLDDVPLSGTGDWTADEKADILEALSVEDGSVATEADLDGILFRVKKSRGR